MSYRYYRRNNEIRNSNKLDQTVDELKNIILGKINGIKQKIKLLNCDLNIIKKQYKFKEYSKI